MQRSLSSLLAVVLALAVAAPTLAASGSKPNKSAGSGSRSGSGSRTAAAPPAIGEQAPIAAVTSLAGEPVDLAATIANNRTVLVVLRGYPGGQCPICSRIVQGFVREAEAFAAADASVVMVYPGAAANLTEQAEEFLGGKALPSPIELVLDPDYALVNAYHLRWNAPNETAYPSTFIIDEGKIVWSKISKTHGGRASAKAVLAALRETAP